MNKRKIAVFANGWSNEYLEQVLEGIRDEAEKDNVDIFVFFTYTSWGDSFQSSESQLNIFHLANPADFDGAIMLANTFNFNDEQEKVCSLFKDKGIPLITTGADIEGLPYMGTSNYEGIHELACHIIEKHNAKKIVYVTGIMGNPENNERQRALEDALSEHNLKLFDTIQGDFSFYGGYDGVKGWLNKTGFLPDAFVCANDHSAIGVCTILQEMGYDIPDDVIVTGYDNVTQARTNVPMIATVGSRWNEMGHDLYFELKNQMINPDPSFRRVYSSLFVPSETCGCKPTKEQVEYRLTKLKNSYYDRAFGDLKHMFYQNIRFALAKVESKEEFFEIAKKHFDDLTSIGDDYWICIEPDFFELDDEKYHKRIRGYSHYLDVIFRKENGIPKPPLSFASSEIVPGYEKAEDKSDIYFILPLCNADYIIGYGVVKNTTEMIYDLSLRDWSINLNTLFVNIRQYIFAQRSNRKLKEIYMRDFLTGLYNRTGCENVLYDKIKKNMASEMTSLLLFADINRMKVINDKFGHLNGDLAIKATSDALRQSLPEGWLFGRYGGDEFIAVGLFDEGTDANLLCRELEEKMKAYTSSLNLSFELSSSVGHTIIRPDTDGEIEDFIQRADEAMYVVKQEAHKKMDAELAE